MQQTVAIPEEGAATASTAAAGRAGGSVVVTLWLISALGLRLRHCKRFLVLGFRLIWLRDLSKARKTTRRECTGSSHWFLKDFKGTASGRKSGLRVQ